MRLSMIVAGLAALILVAGVAARAEAADVDTQLQVIKAVMGPNEGGPDVAPGEPHPGHGKRPRPGADGDRPQKDGDRPDGRPGMQPPIPKFLAMAASAPAIAKDAEAQKLVDKFIADRKVLLKSEADLTEAYENLVKAGRGDNPAAVKEAQEALRTAMEKHHQDAGTVGEDIRAIGERVRELHPRDGRGDGVGAGDGKGDRPRGDRPGKGENKR